MLFCLASHYYALPFTQNPTPSLAGDDALRRELITDLQIDILDFVHAVTNIQTHGWSGDRRWSFLPR